MPVRVIRQRKKPAYVHLDGTPLTQEELDNTVYVGRGGKWGNPYVGPNAAAKFGEALAALNSTYDEKSCPNEFAKTFLVSSIKKNLRGKNLACWCKAGCDCHADVLLELANKGD